MHLLKRSMYSNTVSASPSKLNNSANNGISVTLPNLYYLDVSGNQIGTEVFSFFKSPKVSPEKPRVGILFIAFISCVMN